MKDNRNKLELKAEKERATLLLLLSTALLLLLCGGIASAYGQQSSPPPAVPPAGTASGSPSGAPLNARSNAEDRMRRRREMYYRQHMRDRLDMHRRFAMRSGGMDMPSPFRPHQPPLEAALRVGPPGRWWDNPNFTRSLNLTTAQQSKMDDIFQQSRLHLIDLVAGVQKEEAIMEPLLAANQPDEAKIIAQIDRVAQARAELEKANARMLLDLRRVLTPDQWTKLKSQDRGMHGPGSWGRRDGPNGSAPGDGSPGPPSGPPAP